MKDYCQRHLCLKELTAIPCPKQISLGQAGTVKICGADNLNCPERSNNVLGKYEPEDLILPLTAAELEDYKNSP